MDEEERFLCPSCGTLVFEGDIYCRKCGASLTEFFKTIPETPPPSPEHVTEEPYRRKFSLTQRLYKLLTAPSEAMRDIAFAPDYEGVFVIIAVEFVLLSIGIAMVLQKIQFFGPNAGRISGMVSGILGVAIFLLLILSAVMWLIKSLIVKYACDSGSSWDFKVAASITGYAYIADLIVAILGIFVLWFLLPTFQFDTTNLEAARLALNDYQAQLNWLRLVYSLPVSLFGLLWKSYLGGLGAHFGTREQCSLGTGIAVFFVLGLIGFLISFIT